MKNKTNVAFKFVRKSYPTNQFKFLEHVAELFKVIKLILKTNQKTFKRTG